MRKVLSALTISLVFVLFITGCSGKPQVARPEQQITMEQVNTEGKYVARAFIESIFTDNKAMFDKCYPDGFFERINDSSESALYDQYRSVMKIDATVNGTASTGYRDYCLANGDDEAVMRSNICLLTGFEYSSVGRIQIQKVTVFFSKGNESASADFYYVVYEANGSWYMLEGYQGETGF